jgi:predicted acylesterase/phospholipase RssA
MAAPRQSAEDEAWDIIRGKSATPDRVLQLEKVLRDRRRFGLARKILETVYNDPELVRDRSLRIKVAQKLSLCTYKDPDLPADQKLQDALRFLRATDDLDTTINHETLGLSGAIHKRLWELSAQDRYLEMSLMYYFRGYQNGIQKDFGYTAINAAFVLDLLADLDEVAAEPAPLAAATGAQRRSLATSIRREIIAKLPVLSKQPGNEWLNDEWWFLVTVGEAYLGLDDFQNADVWLKKAAAIPGVPDWEQESTARQLVTILNFKQKQQRRGGPQLYEACREVLQRFLGGNAAALESAVRGKIGLALSGGGFRASFYHIGVLAKLAELDMLRHVEYLSCVSGGSIVGAHFYLEVRKLLEQKPDGAITRQDYIDIVHRIEKDFYDGVSRNIRTRIAAEWLTNLKMIFVPGYSRTRRAGELYEREIYSRIRDGDGNKPRWLDKLKVQPEGEEGEFSPKDHNWRRAAKVPILVLNATTLNTGHNWQFSATWMGEPPAGITAEIDANSRLRRMYYGEAPQAHKHMRLGYAVAASACVPGIFEPLTMLDLYQRDPAEGKRKVTPVVRLVDGGVYDNQGVAALLEQGCSVLLVSDASGQMSDQDFPGNGLLSVPLRSNSILQSRVRVSEFEELSSRRRGGLLKGLMFVHLKKDLDVRPVDWIGCQEPSKPLAADPLTSYGIQKHVQRLLAAMRTDLDSFSEVEAYALMTSGYLMVETELEQPILGFPMQPCPREEWGFLKIEPIMKQKPDENTHLVRQLKVANYLVFKVWLLMRQLQIFAALIVVFLVPFIIYGVYRWWDQQIFMLRVRDIFFSLLAVAFSLAGLSLVARMINYRKTITEIVTGIGMATVGFLLARLHLHVFDRLFLWQGSLRRLLAKTERDQQVQQRGRTLRGQEV